MISVIDNFLSLPKTGLLGQYFIKVDEALGTKDYDTIIGEKSVYLLLRCTFVLRILGRARDQLQINQLS